jgi:hypothetical protein
MKPLQQEEKVREILERESKTKLIKRKLSICARSDNSPIFHEFDIVSVNKDFEFDGKLVGEVKSDKFGSENGYRTTRFCRMVTACMYLQKIKAKKRLLILTNKEFFNRFKKDANGVISKDIDIVHIPAISDKPISKIANESKVTKEISKRNTMKKRNWLVEDNLVALYIALHKYRDLNYGLKEIRSIIPHKGFPMRIQQYIAIHTGGKKGLNAGLKIRLFRELYEMFKDFEQKSFARFINLVLDVKSKVNFTI